MCCERLECYVAVFDHTEAVCYLKAGPAMNSHHFVKQAGFTSHEMFLRGGQSSGGIIYPLFSFLFFSFQ